MACLICKNGRLGEVECSICYTDYCMKHYNEAIIIMHNTGKQESSMDENNIQCLWCGAYI